MNHRHATHALLLLAASTAASACFSTITVGEKITGLSNPEGGVVANQDGGFVVNPDGGSPNTPPDGNVTVKPALDPLLQRVALRVRANTKCTREGFGRCSLADIFEGDISNDGSAYELRQSSLNTDGNQFCEGSSCNTFSQGTTLTWPRIVPRYPSTVEASAASVEGRSVFLSTYNASLRSGSLGETFSRLALGDSASVDPRASAYVQDEGIEATLVLDASGSESAQSLRVNQWLSTTTLADGQVSLRGKFDPLTLNVGNANINTTSWATAIADSVGTNLLVQDGMATPRRALPRPVTVGGETGRITSVAMFRVRREFTQPPTSLAETPPAITVSNSDVSRTIDFTVSSRTNMDRQNFALSQVVALSNVAVGPCIAGSPRQCAYIIAFENKLERLVETVLHRFEWTGSLTGTNLFTHTQSALSVEGDAKPLARPEPRQQKWKAVIATDGGLVAARFDGATIPDVVGAPNVFERHGLYLFHGATGTRVAYRAGR